MCRISLTIISLLASCYLFAQEANFKKIDLSFHAGVDYPIGTSNTVGVDPDFRLPFAHKWSGTFDGAYFFTKNYGVGLKYHFFSAKDEGVGLLRPNTIYGYTMKEATHFIGPALYGRWMLGHTKWEIPVNISLGYVRNTLSDLQEVYRVVDQLEPDGLSLGGSSNTAVYGHNDMKSNTIGVMFSAGIRYRILPFLGIGVYGNGMFASADKQHSTNFLTGQPVTIDNPRKMNRIGFSAGLDICF